MIFFNFVAIFVLKGVNMLKRKFYDTLVEWKNTKTKECLLVKGARQVGKTFIIDKFGKENYKSYIYINFIQEPNLKNIFEGSLAAQDIYKKMSLYLEKVEFVDNNTLIFLDEIQDCPNARTALKFLALDNRFDVIASGSLLGINYKEISSIPVGYEKQVEMFSLDFEEFLWAVGKSEDAIQILREYFNKKEKVPDFINEQYIFLLREYIAVGGMPEVVDAFVKTNNYAVAHETQLSILQSYRADINKYASIPDRQKINNCFESIPRQLAKEYRKFQYKTIEHGATNKKYANSINWLFDAALTRPCQNVSLPQIPLVAYEISDQFKIYMNDTGLLTCMYGWDTQHMILTNELVGPAKGGIYENVVADILTKKGYKLFYYKPENSSQEIEFLLERNGTVAPIEVKAGNNATISLNKFIEKFNPNVAYKLTSGNVGQDNKKITLPIYMAMFI